MMATTTISDLDFNDLRQVIHQLTGIVLDESKKYLVETRIGPILVQLQLASYRRLLEKLKFPADPKIVEIVIDAITTNETFFFREATAYELVRRKLLPEFLDERIRLGSSQPVRFWSAACSSGQELYSLAISLTELIGSLAIQKVVLEGTDISEQILVKASQGIYTKFELDRGMPASYATKYFTSDPKGFKIRDDIRGMCRFSKINLLKLPAIPYRYDVIFCRNVAIYFSVEERIQLFRNLARNLGPFGVLIVGATEQIRGVEDMLELKTDFPSCFYYRRKG